VNAFDPPNGEYGSSFAYDPATKNIVLFGGSSTFGFGHETWTLSGSTWTSTQASGPPNRYFASMAFDPSLNEMVLFGGEGLSGYLNDTWAWNGTTWTELAPSQSPTARYESSMAYDASTHDLVLFGGSGACGISCSDTWVFNGTTWTQAIDPSDTHGCPSTCPNSPPALFWGSMAYDTAKSDIVLFGGENSTATDIAGTWTWNGSVWTNKGADPSSTTSVPAGLYEAAMAYDAKTGNLVLFGGAGIGGAESTTSTWNGSAWTQAIDPGDSSGCPTTCPASPSGRVAPDVTYDPQSGDVVLWGGRDGAGTTLFDTWFWSPPPIVAAPKVSKVSPNRGPARGGTVVVVTGSNLSGATAVHFGASGAHIDKKVSANEIEVTSPKGAGTVDVTVTTAGGTSVKTGADHFSYVVAPKVSKVSPNRGPARGGTVVVVTGSNLSGATAVHFGASGAHIDKRVSANEIKVTSPKGAGTVDVTVTTAGGTSVKTAADHYTY
jgi:hypothetical protein